jgi:cytochrome oxidase assembly protein ShyY1
MVGMVSLGLWQLRRLDERRAFNDRVSAHLTAEAVPVADLVGLPPADAEYRPALISGEYLPDHQFLVVNVGQNGETGRNVVNALELADGSVLIVNRGFAANGTAVPPLPEGEVEMVGVLKKGQRARAGQPADDGTQPLTEIRRIDLTALALQFDQPVQPMYAELSSYAGGGRDPGLQPIPFPSPDEGPHLSYAIQWFVFTLCVAAGWVLAIRKSARERAGIAPRPRRGPPPILDDEPVF